MKTIFDLAKNSNLIGDGDELLERWRDWCDGNWPPITTFETVYVWRRKKGKSDGFNRYYIDTDGNITLTLNPAKYKKYVTDRGGILSLHHHPDKKYLQLEPYDWEKWDGNCI